MQKKFDFESRNDRNQKIFKGEVYRNIKTLELLSFFFLVLNDLYPLIFGLNRHVDKKRTYQRHFCATFASQSVLSCTNFLYW